MTLSDAEREARRRIVAERLGRPAEEVPVPVADEEYGLPDIDVDALLAAQDRLADELIANIERYEWGWNRQG